MLPNAKFPIARACLLASGAVALTCASAAMADDHGSGVDPESTEITQYSVGPVQIGMTIAEARTAAPQMTFTAAGGPENSIMVEASIGKDRVMEIWTLDPIEPDTDGNLPALDPDAVISGITVFDPRFAMFNGIRPGITTKQAERIYGKVGDVFNDPHIGEFGSFASQPDWMSVSFQPAKGGSATQAGIYRELEECQPPRCLVANSFTPGAYIDSVGIGPSYKSETLAIIGAPGFSQIVREMQLECEYENPLTTYTFTLGDVMPGLESLIEVPAREHDCQDERQVLTRVAYADQSEVKAMDINFDSVPDLAIYRGNIGGYGSPAYDIFLFAEPSASWIKHEELSELTRSLGMFDINTEDETFTVYGKSGAAYHTQTKYKFAMEEAEPDAIPNLGPLEKVYEKIVDRLGPGEGTVTERTLVNGMWRETTRPVGDDD